MHYKKHDNRKGSAFPRAQGNPISVNLQAEKVVNDILNNPNTISTQRNTGRLGKVTDIIAPDGLGTEKMKKLTLQLSSVFDKDDLVVGIWNEDNQLAEVYVNNEIKIDIYYLSDSYLSFNLGELQEIFFRSCSIIKLSNKVKAQMATGDYHRFPEGEISK